MARFASFAQLYRFYLSKHRDRSCRRLHFARGCLVLLIVATALLSGHQAWLWLAPLAGYGLSSAGHVLDEKNRPATFNHPFYSPARSWMTFRGVLRGRVRLRCGLP